MFMYKSQLKSERERRGYCLSRCIINRLISGRIVRYFREEAEPLPSSRYRSMSGTRMGQQPGTGIASETGTGVGGGCRGRSYRFRSPGAPLEKVQALTERPAAEPRLTIIDFNQLTRGGLELAATKNRSTVPCKSVKSRR